MWYIFWIFWSLKCQKNKYLLNKTHGTIPNISLLSCTLEKNGQSKLDTKTCIFSISSQTFPVFQTFNLKLKLFLPNSHTLDIWQISWILQSLKSQQKKCLLSKIHGTFPNISLLSFTLEKNGQSKSDTKKLAFFNFIANFLSYPNFWSQSWNFFSQKR